MKNLALAACIILIVYSCTTSKKTVEADNSSAQIGDTIKITSDKTEYEIIIIEPGFNVWLNTTARPEGFYNQTYLENKNIFYVQAWNNRVSQPQRYNPNLYEMQIDYRQNIDYGYELNYKLYNYFIYFQNKYNQNLLGGRVPPF
ncbi:hypothetical protein FHS04_000379 [Mesoflavibacter sabulilitoris]|uniref:Lipoprotein n=1 Tax=Mesoflavibacter zeaxanthinifaciens subsp. sabulilitoris TaxID=1520893 RepID=A0A2T1NGY4_9FLAO|nr:DUF6146 family protein [Mesoflavibacter zeaxanthinifaciens]MBB3122891.1 hypothetical protein [Mesoflavibacter zeaxanthinifaciens subsp. sabulilitoris]PSG92032.1 hypothetical protein C7H61_05495 [Mesoflavibacter zeaxanthinifaciens subsp. sabulilitoris]